MQFKFLAITALVATASAQNPIESAAGDLGDAIKDQASSLVASASNIATSLIAEASGAVVSGYSEVVSKYSSISGWDQLEKPISSIVAKGSAGLSDLDNYISTQTAIPTNVASSVRQDVASRLTAAAASVGGSATQSAATSSSSSGASGSSMGSPSLLVTGLVGAGVLVGAFVL